MTPTSTNTSGKKRTGISFIAGLAIAIGMSIGGPL